MYFPVFAFYGQKLTVSEYADVNAWGVDDKKVWAIKPNLNLFLLNTKKKKKDFTAISVLK